MLQRLALLWMTAAWLVVSCSEIRQPALEASATTTTLSPGKTAQLTVTRHFEGGPIENVTNQVRYTVTPRDIITVSTVGLVTPATETGFAEVHISELDSRATAIVHFEVSASRIASIRLDPGPAITLKPGETRRFTATAVLTDGSETDLTTSAVLSSSNEGAATIGHSQGDVGVVTAVSEGDTTISVTDSVSNSQARTLVFVRGDAPTLVAINVTPNPATVAVGSSLPLRALSVMSNGKTADITSTATWSSSDPTKASVDANGVLSGIAAGTVTITAAEAGGSVKGSLALTIP